MIRAEPRRQPFGDDHTARLSNPIHPHGANGTLRSYKIREIFFTFSYTGAYFPVFPRLFQQSSFYTSGSEIPEFPRLQISSV